MWTRSLIFLGAQLLGAGLGFALHGAWGALAGAAAVVWLWFLVDLMRAGRVLRWLRDAPPGPVPARVGVWGEAVDRVQRLLRQREQQATASDQRLGGMLDALQATPSGVLLLDDKSRIVWCNHNAARHLSIDAQRDAGHAYIASQRACPSSCVLTALARSSCSRAMSRRRSRPSPCGATLSPMSRTKSARR